MARLKRVLRGAFVILIGLVGLAWLGFGVYLLSLFASDRWITLTWHSTTATIEAVGEARNARGGPFFPAVLRVRRADGSVLVDRAAKDLPLPPRDYFLGPRRIPEVGGRVDVHVSHPGAPNSIVPADRLLGWGFAAFVLLVHVIAPLTLLRAMPDMWRAATEPITTPPDGPDAAADSARAKRAKRSRRRRK